MNILQKQLKGILTVALFFVASTSVAQAADGLIQVDFHGNTPLFAEANILPGDGVTRPVTVENISDKSQDVYIQLLDVYQTKDFAHMLEIQVQEQGGGTVLGPVPLNNLFGGTQAGLTSTLESGASVTYDVSISFKSEAGNEYQEGETGFDFCIGFSGGDIGCDGDGGNPDDGNTPNGDSGDNGGLGGPCTNCGGSGDGSSGGGNGSTGNDGNNGVGGSQENLIITNESAENVDDGDGAADLTWDTNKPATSKVVCGLLSGGPYDFTLSDENFGYPWGSEETDTEATDHIVSLIGLDSGTYLCRVASREEDEEEWTVSDEFAFTIAQESSAGNPASFIGTGNTPVAFAAEDEQEEPSSPEEGEEGEDEPSDQVAGAFSSLGDNAVDSTCYIVWWVWILVLIAFLIATLWSREMLTHLSAQQPVKRLFALSAVGLILFVIAFFQYATEWLLPMGIGTIALIIASIVDTVRAKEGVLPPLRLKWVITTLLSTTLIALLLAVLLDWLCSIVPLIIIAIVLGIRYALHQGKWEQ